MSTLKFMESQPLDPKLMICPYCGEEKRIGIHQKAERRLKCHACQGTFVDSKGTVFFGLHYPVWVIILVLTLLAYGCPVAAIVAAFYLDERTVASWQYKAGQQGQQVQRHIVCKGQIELGQVQADELCVKTQQGKVWVATAMSVFSRLFLWGEVSARRDRQLIERLMVHVRLAAAGVRSALLFAVDGFAAYPKAILKTFYTCQHSGTRPRHLPWPDLHIVQVVKSYSGQQLQKVQRRLVHGSLDRVYDLIACSQVGLGQINTAYLERLNATFRARMPCLARRTRSLARTPDRLQAELFWTGVVYNFCTVHSSLGATPAMAAGLTQHVWSVEALLRFRLPPKRLHVPV